MKIRYFGTNLNSAGHYMWDVGENGVFNMSLDTRHLGFDPEDFFNVDDTRGTTKYAIIGNTTIFGICGSPVDKRRGCKSVFFIEGKHTEDEIKTVLLGNGFFNKLKNLMGVDINL